MTFSFFVTEPASNNRSGSRGSRAHAVRGARSSRPVPESEKSEKRDFVFPRPWPDMKNENESAGGRARINIDRDRGGDRGPGAVGGSLSDLHGKDVPAPTETFIPIPGEGDGCP